MFYIDEMRIGELQNLSSGSVLTIGQDSSKLTHIPSGVRVRLTNTRQEQIRSLPLCVSHLRITSTTYVETIRHIPKDKVLEVDVKLTHEQIAAIKSKTISLFIELGQITIDRLISNLRIEQIIFSPDISEQAMTNLLAKLHRGLESYCKDRPGRKLLIKNPLEQDPVSIVDHEPEMPIENIEMTEGAESVDFVAERESLLKNIHDLQTRNDLLQTKLATMLNEYNDFKESSEKTSEEYRERLSILQLEALKLRQTQLQPSTPTPYVGMTMNKITKKREMDSLRSENERLKKALDETTRDKTLAETQAEDARRAAVVIFKNSSLSFFSNYVRPNSQSLQTTLPDLGTSVSSASNVSLSQSTS